MKQVYLTSAVLLFTGFYACKDGTRKEEAAVVLSSGVELANLDTTVSPQDDFFHYANGNWLKNNPVPASESSWGSFNQLRDENNKSLKKIVDELITDNAISGGSNQQKVRDFYAMAMDSAKIEKDGLGPLKGEFDKINEVKKPDDLANLIAYHHSIGITPLFVFFVDQDQKKSSETVSYLYQGGLGLPDRDYYLSPDENSVSVRKEYNTHLQKMFELMGDKSESASKAASVIMDIETKLAKASMTRVQLRDIEAQYNKRTVAEVNKLSPAFNWGNYFKTLGVSGINEVIVAQPEFLKQVGELMKSVPIENWKTYLRWHLIHGTAYALNDDFVNEHFRLYGTVLNGSKALKPRWKRSLEATDASLGEALGQLYVEKHFSVDSKKRVNEMVDNLTASYEERINSREWMSPETKQQALAKLRTIVRKLGYPDKWRDYSKLEIKRDSYVQNFLRANQFGFDRMISKLGKPVDRTEWGMTPPTINAYYNPSMNEIVFPAGIMQPPFFNPAADDAVNYGCMGAVIGHELTHGFDDQGCQFDAEGNLKNWWTEEDKAKFKSRTALLVKQFNSFLAVDTFHVNGQLTLGENIADLGGLTLAYAAYKKSLKGQPSAKIDGFTGEQRFFLGWSQGWRINMRPEALKQMVRTNPHSPGNFRVNGPLSNMPEFYEAFGIKEGHKMHQPAAVRAEIW